MSRAQEGRDAVCPYEAHPQARPASTARLERRQGRGAAHRNRAEPEATRQAPLPCPTTAGLRLPSLGVPSSVGADVGAPQLSQRASETTRRPRLKADLSDQSQPSFPTQSTRKRKVARRRYAPQAPWIGRISDTLVFRPIRFPPAACGRGLSEKGRTEGTGLSWRDHEAAGSLAEFEQHCMTGVLREADIASGCG